MVSQGKMRVFPHLMSTTLRAKYSPGGRTHGFWRAWSGPCRKVIAMTWFSPVFTSFVWKKAHQTWRKMVRICFQVASPIVGWRWIFSYFLSGVHHNFVQSQTYQIGKLWNIHCRWHFHPLFFSPFLCSQIRRCAHFPWNQLVEPLDLEHRPVDQSTFPYIPPIDS